MFVPPPAQFDSRDEGVTTLSAIGAISQVAIGATTVDATLTRRTDVRDSVSSACCRSMRKRRMRPRRVARWFCTTTTRCIACSTRPSPTRTRGWRNSSVSTYCRRREDATVRTGMRRAVAILE